MTMTKQVRLERPGSGGHEPRTGSPPQGGEVKQESSRDTEEQNRPKASPWQIVPGGRKEIAKKAKQGIERRMPVRLGPGEWPEIGKDLGVEKQLAPGVDLVSARRLCPDLLHQLQVGWCPFGSKSDGVAQGMKPLAQAGLTTQRVTLVPDDRQTRFCRQHDHQGGYPHDHAQDSLAAGLANHRRAKLLAELSGFAIQRTATVSGFEIKPAICRAGSRERISATSWQLGKSGQRTHSFQILCGSSALSIWW